MMEVEQSSIFDEENEYIGFVLSDFRFLRVYLLTIVKKSAKMW